MRTILFRTTYVFLLIINLFSCISCARAKVSHEVRKVIGQTITYPNDMECFKGENNHFSPLEEPQMTILVWFDSTECSACKLNGIKTFQGLLSYCRDTIGSADIRFVFSPSHESISSLYETINENGVEYSIYIDRTNSFGNYNSFFSKNKNLHTVLLNQENKIVLIGNPLLSDQMYKLYKQTIRSQINLSKK